MRNLMTAAAAALLLTGAALAQDQSPPANNGPANPPVKTEPGNNPGAPVAGANSYSQSEAKSRMEAMGFTHVTMLAKDDTGVWRAHARKGHHKVIVSLDYQGNVVAE